MAAISVEGGGGSTQYPKNLNSLADRINGQNSSANWWTKYISSYNQPPTKVGGDYYARMAADKRNAEIIAEAQRKAQEAAARANQAAADRYTAMQEAQSQQQRPVSFIGDMPAGPIGQFLANPLESLSNFLTSKAPNFPIKTDPMGNPLPGQEVNDRATQVNPTRGEERPGYMQQPVMNSNGQIIGYEYVKLVRPQEVTVEEQTAATQNTTADAATRRAVGEITIYDEIKNLENSYASRRYDAAVRAYGEPTKDKNPDGSDKLTWGSNGQSYLGMAPGEIASPTLQAPAENAPYSDWVKYRDRLRAQQSTMTKQMYTESSVKEAYYGLGTKGVKELQKAFLAAGLYDSNDIVALGNVGEKELSFMRDLMTTANINGTTWEEQFSIFQSAAAAQKARGGGGGGGGGGGAGTAVSTQIMYNQTSLAQGRTLLISVLKDALGRYPTDDEITRFIDMLNKAESKSPTKTVTTTTRQGKASRVVSRTTPSEVDAQAMAEEFVQSIGGGAPAAANSNDMYISALLKSLGGTSV